MDQRMAHRSSPESVSTNNARDVTAQNRRRIATVYDAVAARVYHDRPLRDQDDVSRDVPHSEAGAYRESTHRAAFTPDEVLFRRKNAPERFAEHDVYYANERNLPHGDEDVLPDSDLLKAVHSYSSKFYDAVARQRGKGTHHRPSSHTPLPPNHRTIDERSMDETALLAFGILLEEAGRDVLGRRGDLVFTEAAVDASEAEDDDGALDHDPHRLEYEEEEEDDEPQGEDQENEAIESNVVSQARPKRRKIGTAR